MFPFRKILVPMDPSPCSARALALARSLAEAPDVRVDVLHVHEGEGFNFGEGTPLAPDERRRAEQQMQAAIDEARAALGSRLGQTTEPGDPVRRILATAAEGRYDVIVMGTHGRIGRLHAILGSVAEGVVRNAPCPVLTVRESAGEESFSERIHPVPGGEPPAGR